MGGPRQRRRGLLCLALAALVALSLLASGEFDSAAATLGVRRLAIRLPVSGRVGTSTTLELIDRLRIGDLPVSVCVQAPADPRARCHEVTIPAGQATARLALVLPRIGGWLVSAQVSGEPPQRRMLWAAHPGPIRLLALGDSEMQVLDSDLAEDLARYRVSVTSLADPGSGLTVPTVLNWQLRTRQLVAALRPDISIVAMGANDGYGVSVAGRQVNCCAAPWSDGYSRLVAMMARTLLRGQSATADWFELATPKPAGFQQLFNSVNAGIAGAARALHGRLGLIDASAFFTPGDRYRNQMTVAGRRFVIHEPDGIHLDATADQYAAALVIAALVTERVLR